MPSELIKYIGKTCNAWHTSIALLESHMLLMNEAKCSESLAELYRLLNEDDMRYGLWKRRSITAETRAGLSLVQHGYWQQAQTLFYQAMIKATQGTYNNTVPTAEMCLWEEQWLSCATQLGQWEVLADFGKGVENYEILLDCLWKAPDWTYMKEHVIPKAQVEETPKLRLIQAFFTLHDKGTNGVGEAENLVSKGVELALEQWWQLPEMSVQSRMPLLQQFQQLVEVKESSKILLDIANGNKPASGNSGASSNHQNSFADLKDILETWRLRTPNDWDNTTIWYDLLQWRNEMYNSVIDAFKDFGQTNPQLHHLGYRDKAWNVNKLAHITRKHGLPDVCVTILDKMYGHATMEVQEAFVKICEQAKAYLDMKGELVSGLNLINNTNLEFFPVKNKAEIFRLKGDFMLKMNDCENANVVYSNAITLFKHLPKGWISWGNYCDMIFKETQEERNEAQHCKLVLLKIAQVYPQALYYWLRTYLMERRDVATKTEMGRNMLAQQRLQQAMLANNAANNNSAGGNLTSDNQVHQAAQSGGATGSHEGGNLQGQEVDRSTVEGGTSTSHDQGQQSSTGAEGSQNALRRNNGLGWVTSAASAFDAAKDIMEALRSKHTNLANELEEYKQDFERDLDPDSATTFPSTLAELTERLKHWKNILQSNVEDRFPAVLKLEEESKVLRDFHVVDVELPGQYFTDQEVAPDHTVKLDRVGPDIPIVRRHGSSFRRLTLIGSDGSQRHFIVQTSLTPNARSDERMLQLFRVLNKMFDKHKESRRRHLAIHTPIIIPVWSQVRMVEDDLMYSTFLEVYEINCARHNREADSPITIFKEQLNQAISGQVSPEQVVELRLQAYNEITKSIVNDNIFSQYMHKILPTGNHLWTFKKQFAIQVALSCFMSYMLQIGGRAPNKILFAKNTGKIFQTDFHPAYDPNGLVEFNELVPFRLTRNMQAFFSNFGVEANPTHMASSGYVFPRRAVILVMEKAAWHPVCSSCRWNDQSIGFPAKGGEHNRSAPVCPKRRYRTGGIRAVFKEPVHDGSDVAPVVLRDANHIL
ncbi:hypothetical protein ACQJBY_014578 [Aegilops geniculata]